MPRFALEIEFDGSRFNGTQAQDARARTLQGVVEDALGDLAGEPVRFRPASRLDQGVSSPALPGDCLVARDWAPEVLAAALNERLPEDAVVRRAARVDDAWSARKAAVRKTYRYRVAVRMSRPVLDGRCWWQRGLDHPQRLHELAPLLIGEHDLSGFACKRGDERDDEDPRRRYEAAAWTAEPTVDGALWTFAIVGQGFLYQQVRGLVGAMIGVARGRATVDGFRALMAAGWGAPRIGNMAPGNGLTLVAVDYDPPPDWRASR